MELRQLRYFIALIEEGTFVRAAERLNLAQPALSRQIQALEKELGSRLVERGRKGVALTPGGAICLGAAYSIVRQADAMMERARMAEAGHVGNCAMYVSFWALQTGFSGKLVAYLAETEPGIEIGLEEAGPGGHWGSVNEGKVDLAIATKPDETFTNLVSEPLLDDAADIAILSPSHRLADRDSISIHELEDELFLMYDPKIVNYIDHDLESAFAAVEFSPSSRKFVTSSEGLLAMVGAGIGWSLHRRSLRGLIPGVATVHVTDFQLRYPIAIVRRKGRTSPVTRTVIRRTRELASREYPDIYIPGTSEVVRAEALRPSIMNANKLEIRDLRYYVTAIDAGSIGRGASKLGISQPALSRQLRNLDEDIGVDLVRRSARGIEPTEAGKSFLADAREVLAQVDDLASEVERGERGVSGRCLLGLVPSLEVQSLVSRTVRSAAERFSGIDIHLLNIPTPRQPEAVATGKLDLGICHPFPGLTASYPDLDCREILSDTINCALVSTEHPLADREMIDLSELSDIPFLFFRREFHPAFYDFLMDAFRERNFRPKEGSMQEGLQTMWALTAANAGWSLGFGRQRDNPPAGSAAVPIKDFSLPWGAVLLSRRNERRPAALALMDLIHNEAQAS